MKEPFFSIIIPVYNRPLELEELLTSLLGQHYRQFEVIIVEDGSSNKSDQVSERFSQQLKLRYYFQPNQGPGPARNFGFKQADGDFFISFDSDCVIPPEYLQSVVDFMSMHQVDAWGGPDAGHSSFTHLQRAMAYTMSALLTTGGIRGGTVALDHFQPRSFNMGISRKVFEATGGFHFDRFAEDIELSIRIRKACFSSWLIPGAFVYHKRRTSLGEFFRQVKNFGKGRVEVSRSHPGTLKLTHWLPFLFTAVWMIGLTVGLVFKPLLYLTISVYGIYFFMLFTGSLIQTGSFLTSILSIPSALIQLTGYAWGFFQAIINDKKD